MLKKKRNSAWFRRHLTDKYVKLSKVDGLPSRAAYKLIELNKRFNILKPGIRVVDLGSSPGGWSKVMANSRNQNNDIVDIFSLDIRKMELIHGVKFIQGDFSEENTINFLLKEITTSNSKGIDLILSDMAPDISGIKDADFAKMLTLINSIFYFSNKILKIEGNLLFKLFQIGDIDTIYNLLKKSFKKVYRCRLDSSYSESKEIYYFAKCKTRDICLNLE